MITFREHQRFMDFSYEKGCCEFHIFSHASSVALWMAVPVGQSSTLVQTEIYLMFPPQVKCLTYPVKYLNIYCMYWLKIWFTYPVCPENVSCWLQWSVIFPLHHHEVDFLVLENWNALHQRLLDGPLPERMNIKKFWSPKFWSSTILSPIFHVVQHFG